jgi:hypothetical protein
MPQVTEKATTSSSSKNPLGGEPGGLRDKLWTKISGSK